MATAIHHLGWSDVVPSAHPFNPAPVEPIAGSAAALRGQKHNDAIVASIDRALLAEYGSWIAGWQWGASEPGGGGPVRKWCCARDSLFRKDDKSTSDAARRVAEAVLDWRGFLEELERVFDELPPLGSTSDQEVSSLRIASEIEEAAARLLPVVVEHTSAEDAWYRTFVVVLTWYVESKGGDADVYGPIIEEAVSGTFQSWVAPSSTEAAGAFSWLANRILEERAPTVVDGTAAWRSTRGSAFARLGIQDGRRDPITRDAHRAFIEGPERARDTSRADAMDVALDACRSAAAAKEPLTFETLAAWQGIVLGLPSSAPFRKTDAFAKHGRERYPILGAEEGFRAALLDANDEAAPVTVRAARVYLDVLFFHPFEDGNARAARLALDFVLSRAGFGLHSVEPLFALSRSPNDRGGPWYFAYVLDYLMGPSATR